MRLTLSWMDKDKSLASTPEGGYEFVDRDDPRVSEVRPFETIETVGDATGVVGDNLLVIGDGADMMRTLVRLPEYADEYRGRVKLVYIDPPFNTGQAFEHYDDGLEHSVWLTMMRDRLVLIRDLLAPDGSVWVHLDDAEMAYCKVLMDEVFGRSSFVTTVIWRSSDNSNNDAKTLSSDHNSILVFARSGSWQARREEATAERLPHYGNPDGDPRGPYFDGNPLNSPNPRDNLRYDLIAPDGTTVSPPPNGWRWSRETMASKLASGEIRWRDDMSGIRRRTYLADHSGLPASNLWMNLAETGHNRQAKYELKNLFPDTTTSELFKTPKPERLLRRIIALATEPGDVVVDAFAGSGTTAAVAQKMGRRWVTSEREASTVCTYTNPRLAKVVAGEDPGGVTDAVGWEGGGGFRVVAMAPSIFEVVEGRVFLSPTATNGKFSDGVRAQLGFAVLDEAPFCGRKGQMRLVAIDGVVDEGTVQMLTTRSNGEPITVVGKGITDGVVGLLAELAPGSIVRKAPAGLLRRRVRGVGR